MKKSVLALLLAVIMAAALLTVGAFAADPEPGTAGNPFTSVSDYNTAVEGDGWDGKDVYLKIDDETFDESNPFNLTYVQSRVNPPKLHLTITNCEFTGNTANDTTNPSFMYLSNCQELIIKGCEFNAGDSGLVYGINWNLIQITGATVKITNCTFNGNYSENAIKLNQRNGADDTAADVSVTGEFPATIASAEISDVTINSNVPVILLGSAGKNGTQKLASPSTGAFHVTISNCKGSDGKAVNVFLAYNASDAEATTLKNAMADPGSASDEALALMAKLVVTVGANTSVSKTANGDLASEEDFVASIGTDKFTSLESAITAAANNSTIVMEKNYTFTAPITFDTNKKITLDLNGKTLKFEGDKSDAQKYAITLCNNAELTITDTVGGGEFISNYRVILVGNGASGKNNSTGATLTVNGGKITSQEWTEDGDEIYHCAISIRGDYTYTEGNDRNVACVVTINNATINGGIYIFGKGAVLNVNNGAYITTNSSYAISGNGTVAANNDQGHTVINITGGTIEQNATTGAAIYHPQSGELNISDNPVISGATGIQLCSGKGTVTNITGGTIKGFGEDNRDGKTGDGFISDGAAVSMVDRSYPGGEPAIDISGGTFISEHNDAVLAYTWAKQSDGTYEETKWEGATDAIEISNGSFSSSVTDYLADNLKYQLKSSNGMFSYYSNFEDALAVAENDSGAVITYVGSSETAATLYTVTIVYGNGTDNMVLNLPAGSYTLPAAPSKPGYIFLGWRNGGTTYGADDTYTLSGDMTFTAVWANMPDVTPSEPDDEPDDEPDVTEFPFDDVSVLAWYYDAVKYVYDNDLMNGTDVNQFSPNSPLTRAMVWAVLARMDGKVIEGDDWMTEAQAWAVESGVSDGSNPTGYITREQLVTMLYRFASEPETGSDVSGYPDAGSISDWAADAMAWAVKVGLIEGDDVGALNPTANSTRAHAATFFMRFNEL